MAESRHQPEFALVYYSHLHKAQWLLPCQAWLLLDADPRVDLIDEKDKFYADYAKLAGPKPKVLV